MRSLVVVAVIVFVLAAQAGSSARVRATPPDPAATAAAAEAAAASPDFLTLPFASLKGMRIQQAWWFTGYSRLHQGIDYIKGRLDNVYTWKSFPVVAAASGEACAQMKDTGSGCIGASSTAGNRILIKHRINGRTYFTYYGHLKSIIPAIPRGSRSHTVHVERGQVIGYSGHTGNPWYLTHLHFELQNRRNQPLDPYDLYETRQHYPNPRGNNGKHNGPNAFWTNDPPILPSTAAMTGRPGDCSAADPATGSKTGADAGSCPAPAAPVTPDATAVFGGATQMRRAIRVRPRGRHD